MTILRQKFQRCLRFVWFDTTYVVGFTFVQFFHQRIQLSKKKRRRLVYKGTGNKTKQSFVKLQHKVEEFIPVPKIACSGTHRVYHLQVCHLRICHLQVCHLHPMEGFLARISKWTDVRLWANRWAMYLGSSLWIPPSFLFLFFFIIVLVQREQLEKKEKKNLLRKKKQGVSKIFYFLRRKQHCRRHAWAQMPWDHPSGNLDCLFWGVEGICWPHEPEKRTGKCKLNMLLLIPEQKKNKKKPWCAVSVFDRKALSLPFGSIASSSRMWKIPTGSFGDEKKKTEREREKEKTQVKKTIFAGKKKFPTGGKQIFGPLLTFMCCIEYKKPSQSYQA